jgi:hypothetical protein
MVAAGRRQSNHSLEENIMGSKYVSGALILALGFVLCMPAKAQNSGKIVSNGTIVGAIVGIAAGVAVIAIVAIHYSKKRTITGCVKSDGNGLSVTDEKDKQVYALSGETTGVKAGDRVKLQGKKVKSKDSNKPLEWETKNAARDLGVCQF